jgi:hypothetical protein
VPDAQRKDEVTVPDAQRKDEVTAPDAQRKDLGSLVALGRHQRSKIFRETSAVPDNSNKRGAPAVPLKGTGRDRAEPRPRSG